MNNKLNRQTNGDKELIICIVVFAIVILVLNILRWWFGIDILGLSN